MSTRAKITYLDMWLKYTINADKMEKAGKKVCSKYCFVACCTNSTRKTPEKRFITVPKGKVRENWFKRAGRDLKTSSLLSSFYCCEDHFNLAEDIENYTRIRFDPRAKVFLKKDALPRFFTREKNTIEDEDKFVGKQNKRKKGVVNTAKKKDFVASSPTEEENVEDDKDQTTLVKIEEYSENNSSEYSPLFVDIFNIQGEKEETVRVKQEIDKFEIKEEPIELIENSLEEKYHKNHINLKKEHIKKCLDETICYLIETRQYSDYISKISFLEQLKKEL
ncbi:unnamed protein product [Brassicogethes aeneus]|uniref:THAP-type domain-containing protein n=1 Tax=Brassicogethes aeneus TaxID=1431903 RepID=A0A9P0AV21_BRAAE|nr:unnamed protein product [Brassicogethes aeneus]